MIELYRTEYDPEASEEGGIDPLGLGSMAERLGQLIVPGLLERHRRPGFLTLIAVGFSILEDVKNLLPENEWKVDFWEAYEWTIVTGLVSQNITPLDNLPSIGKSKNAKAKGLQLNPDRYLKTPSVFGFRGVYKFLAKNMNIELNDLMAENGNLLFRTWAKEQKVLGFVLGESGPGLSERKKIVNIICESLKKGQLTESWNQNSTIWKFISTNLYYLNPSEAEKKLILEFLSSSSERKEIIDFLKSNKGKKYLLDWSLTEREFYSDLASQLDNNSILCKRIITILAYESFSKTLTNSFEYILFSLSKMRLGLTCEELASNTEIEKLSQKISKEYNELSNALHALGENELIQKQEPFNTFGSRLDTKDFIFVLIEHHNKNQKGKAPHGKQSWLQEGSQNGSWVVRPGYTRENKPENDNKFVHFYRLGPLRLFLLDLGIYEKK